jgi:hypothetical protein
MLSSSVQEGKKVSPPSNNAIEATEAEALMAVFNFNFILEQIS